MTPDFPSAPLSPSLGRRPLLAGAGAVLAALALGPGAAAAAVPRSNRLPAGLFRLGVASGDPLPERVVLWTRLAPKPLEPGGGMPPVAVPVRWEVAHDQRFARLVRSGTTVASPDWAHSVHVDVPGLEPGRWYFYRFLVGSEASPVARTKTAPAPGAKPAAVSFAFASCQDWQNGYYAAYRHMAAEDLDLVVHLGDYIYDTEINPKGTPTTPGLVRPLPPAQVRPVPHTLTDYRLRYGLYKIDPDLQLAHAAFPWAITWDDHEVEGNWAGTHPGPGGGSPESFRARLAAAAKAYYEHMPFRLAARPRGTEARLYRRLGYGRLMEFNVTDTRRYRDEAGCLTSGPEPCPDFTDPRRSMLGAAQEKWLYDGLRASSARWNVITAQVPMTRLDYQVGPGQKFSSDKWDGYAANRQRLLGTLEDGRVSNPIVLSGDAHINLVSDLTLDFDDPKAKRVATEFLGTAIASRGATVAEDKASRELLKTESPHVRYFEGYKRGYVTCRVTDKEWRTTHRAVDTTGERGQVASPSAGIVNGASFVVENGVPGVHRD